MRPAPEKTSTMLASIRRCYVRGTPAPASFRKQFLFKEYQAFAGILVLMLFCSCATSKKGFDPYKKFSPAALREDFDVYQQILEQRHPSLYWYTPKSQMDQTFNKGRLQLNDSLTEYEFRKVVSVVNSKIECGHTSVKSSKQYLKYVDTLKSGTTFPLYIKTWNDTVVVVRNIYRNHPAIERGTMIDSIDGIAVKELLDTMYQYLNADGGNRFAKDQTLSTGTWFGSLYTSIYGWKRNYRVAYRDGQGTIQTSVIKPLVTRRDTTIKRGQVVLKKQPKKPRKVLLDEVRYLQIDSTGTTALMELNSFSEKQKLRSFFKNSFRLLEKEKVKNLIIDLRGNAGGRVGNSNLLTKYLAQKPFKLADSLYAKPAKGNYGKFIKHNFWTKLAMGLVTRKDGNRRHYRFFEKHFFKPRKQNHFNGNVYLLSGGNSFSASTLVMSTLREQDNVVIIGEPSGGAAYGNTAWFIPEVTLPNTKIRFRLPLFRLVINKTLAQNGKGVQPEVWVGPSIDAIRKGEDYKMKKTIELIRGNQ